jgi:hypothetical protein
VLSADLVSYTGGTATFDTPAAGSGKAVTGTGLALSGGDAGNYTVNSVALTTASIAAVVAPVTPPVTVVPPIDGSEVTPPVEPAATRPSNLIPVRSPVGALSGLNLTVMDGGVRMPTIQVAATPPERTGAMGSVPEAPPVIVPPEAPPAICKAPERPCKPDRE